MIISVYRWTFSVFHKLVFLQNKASILEVLEKSLNNIHKLVCMNRTVSYISDILAGKAAARRKSRGRPTSIESQRDPLGRQSSTSSLGANTSYDGEGDERTYDCDICGKQFSHNDRLRRHRKIHTTEKPYKCDICGKGFKEKCNLKHHRYIHTGNNITAISTQVITSPLYPYR